MRLLFKFLFICWFWPIEAGAFRLSPMVATFTESGEGASQAFVIENNQKEKVALEMAVFVRKVDENGKEERVPTSDFSIYPEQMILDSEEKRNLRVTYLGATVAESSAAQENINKLTSELAYRLVVSQVSVELKKPEENKTSGPKVAINFLLQYVASLYVTPANAFPIVTIDSFQALGKEKALVVLKNTGTAHKILDGLKIKILNPEKLEVNVESLKGIQAENLLAGNTRRFEVKLNQQTPEGPISAKLELPSPPTP